MPPAASSAARTPAVLLNLRDKEVDDDADGAFEETRKASTAGVRPGAASPLGAAGGRSSFFPDAGAGATIKTDRLPYQSAVRWFYGRKLVQIGVAFVIVSNFIVTILEKEYDATMPQQHEELWLTLDTVFNSLFLVELLINMYGSFWCPFWRSGWNVFDFVVVLVGVLMMTRAPLGPLSDLKMLRAFRIFRLFKRIKSLNKIIEALLRSIPGVFNAFVIMLIFMCIYAILAVEYFRHFGEDGTYFTSDAYGVGDDAYSVGRNVTSLTLREIRFGEEYYGTFSRALYTLFQVLTGESWAEAIARPLIFGKPNQNSSWNVFAVSIFFVSFILLHQIVLVNVVVAVLLDKFVTEEEPNESARPPSGRIDVEQQVRHLRAEVHDQIAGMEDVKRQLERVLLLLSEESQARLHAPLLSATAPSGPNSQGGAPAVQHKSDDAS